MATPTGGQYVFTTADGTPVDLFLTPGGGTPPPGPGGNAFDLEVFTVSNPGTSDPGYEGSAFAEGGTQTGDTVSSANLQLNDGDYVVMDFGGSDSIIAGSGNQTIFGGVQTTIIGGTGTLNVNTGNENLVILGNAASATVNALGGNGERVMLGTNAATVYASANDTVDAGAGTGGILFGSEESPTVTAQLQVQGSSANTLTVSSANYGSLIVTATNATVVGLGKDTISTGAVTATVNTFNSDATVFLGTGDAVVYADAGDAITAGAGSATIAFGADEVTPIGDQMTVTGASTDTFTVASGTLGTLVVGAAAATITALGQDTISTGNVAALVNALDLDVQTINFGDGDATATVYAGAGDIMNAGASKGVIVYGDATGVAGAILTVQGASANTVTVATAAFGTLIQAAANATITSYGADTISTGAVAAKVNTFDPDAQVVNFGETKSTVYAGTGDTINAGTSKSTILFGDSVSLDAQLTVTGASTNVYTITALDGDVLTGTATTMTITSLAAETIAPGAVKATINALDPTSQFLALGKSASTIYAGAGDTIDAGKGQAIVILETGGAMTLKGASATDNISVISASGTVVGSATNSTIVGASGDTIVATDSNQTVNAIAGNIRVSISGGTDTVFGAEGDVIGVGPEPALGTTLGGSELWVNSTLSGGGAIGFGTFVSTPGASSVTATVGTVSGAGTVSEGFDITDDFIFYPNETDAVSVVIIATATESTIGTETAVTFELPDGTTMTLIGVTQAELDPVNMFRPVPG